MSVCETLLSTYNTNILNIVSDKEKFIWKIVCKFLNTQNIPINKKEIKIFNLIKNKENHKKVLSNLIYNHFNLQKPNYKYISGPINCSL